MCFTLSKEVQLAPFPGSLLQSLSAKGKYYIDTNHHNGIIQTGTQLTSFTPPSHADC